MSKCQQLPTIIGILTIISMIKTTSERLKARNFFICRYCSFYEQLEFRAQLSFITLGLALLHTVWDIRRLGSNGRSLVSLESCTVKPVLNGHSKIDKTKVLMTNGGLMKVESIAECSFWDKR